MTDEINFPQKLAIEQQRLADLETMPMNESVEISIRMCLAAIEFYEERVRKWQ